MTRILFLVTLLALVIVGCGSNERDASYPSGDQPPMPTGSGTKRALVLFDGDAPPPSRPSTPQDNALSTRRIVKKVVGD